MFGVIAHAVRLRVRSEDEEGTNVENSEDEQTEGTSDCGDEFWMTPFEGNKKVSVTSSEGRTFCLSTEDFDVFLLEENDIFLGECFAFLYETKEDSQHFVLLLVSKDRGGFGTMIVDVKT